MRNISAIPLSRLEKTKAKLFHQVLVCYVKQMLCITLHYNVVVISGYDPVPISTGNLFFISTKFCDI